MKRIFMMLATVLAMAFAISANAALVSDFSSPVTLSATQADGVWYTDRYAPAGFSASGGVLTETISSADRLGARPSGMNTTFYNTQGRGFNMAAGVTDVSIDLFVPATYQEGNQHPTATTNGFIAGLWGVAYDSTSTLSSYPILEFASDGLTGWLQGWDNGVWHNYALPTSFAYDGWHKFGLSLNGSNWDYLLDGSVVGSVDSGGSTNIGSVILEGYNAFNSFASASYDIKWDNLRSDNGAPSSNVPEPGSLALLSLAGFCGVIASRRKKSSGDKDDMALAV